jgi:hypothetical protein
MAGCFGKCGHLWMGAGSLALFDRRTKTRCDKDIAQWLR